MFNKLGAVRPAARSLVSVLDARDFAKESYHFASDRQDRSMQLSFKKALQLLPNTECILLDGHTDLDLGFLIGHKSDSRQQSPLLLSIADCPFELPGNFFTSQLLSELIYLDLSAVPGSVRSVLHPGLLPGLRVLKLRDRELDDAWLKPLLQLYGLRLWSLDVSENRITDQVIQSLRDKCFPRTDLRTPGYFYTEGKLVAREGGTEEFGPFIEIQESRWSKNFTHPERFFVDSPAYEANASPGLQEYHVFRANGSGPMRKDTAEGVVKLLTSPERHSPSARGLTHLNLSNNLVSSAGIQRLLRTGNGQLEYLACDSLPFLPPSVSQNYWPISARLIGTVGTADYFRPVYSSNLRSLRIHHSFVTGILDLDLEGFSSLSRIYLAEKSILPRLQTMYHGAFMPDMNPRLTSLTLTHVPRRSSGPLINGLLTFLKLLSQQEGAIQEAASSSDSSWRAPDLLSGLRQLRLEFEPDPMEEGFSTAEDLDAENLMSSGDQGFSFFEGEQYEKAPVFVRHGHEPGQAENADSTSNDATSNESVRGDQQTTAFEGEWEDKSFTCQVWLGPQKPPARSAMARYQSLVQVHKVRDGVGPATPSQLRAGAPEGSYIFHTAWNLAIMPQELKAPPKSELETMKDVLDALKQYRLAGRTKHSELERRAGSRAVPRGGPHFFWTGKLEVSTQQPLPQGRASQYWR